MGHINFQIVSGLIAIALVVYSLKQKGNVVGLANVGVVWYGIFAVWTDTPWVNDPVRPLITLCIVFWAIFDTFTARYLYRYVIWGRIGTLFGVVLFFVVLFFGQPEQPAPVPLKCDKLKTLCA